MTDRRRRRRYPAPRSADHLERRLRDAALRIALRPAIRLVRAFKVALEQGRADAEGWRLDAADDFWDAALKHFQAEGEKRKAEREAAEKAAKETARLLAKQQAEDLQLQLGAAVAPSQPSRAVGIRYLQAVGVEPFGSEPWLDEVISKAAQESAALVTSIPEQYLDYLGETVESAVRLGMGTEELARHIERNFLQPDEGRLGQAQRRAQLIAADQLGRVTAQLQQRRQEALGVQRYTWRTSRDERVRSEHKAREGKVYSWDSPPPDGHPGEPIRCRCYSEPVIPGIDEPQAAPAPAPPRRLTPEQQLRREVLGVQRLVRDKVTQVKDSGGWVANVVPDLDRLTERERAWVEAVTLWSAGNVASVRNPSRFDPNADLDSIYGPFLEDPVAVGRTARQLEVQPSREAYAEAGRLLKRLAKAPNVQTQTVYRGLSVTRKALSDMAQVGAEVRLGPIASFSYDPEVAENFALENTGRRKVAVELVLERALRGTDISMLSAMPDEAEFITAGRVRVLRTETRTNGSETITRLYVEQQPVSPKKPRRDTQERADQAVSEDTQAEITEALEGRMTSEAWRARTRARRARQLAEIRKRRKV